MPGPLATPVLQIRDGAYLPHWTKDGAIYAVERRGDGTLPPFDEPEPDGAIVRVVPHVCRHGHDGVHETLAHPAEVGARPEEVGQERVVHRPVDRRQERARGAPLPPFEGCRNPSPPPTPPPAPTAS